MLAQDIREPLQEEVLQPVRVVRSHPGHERPAVRAPLPLRHVHLVAADMDVFRREEPADFAQNIPEQLVVLLARHAPGVAVVVSGGGRRVGGVGAADFGMHRPDRAAVPREVDLGDHLDVADGGIADDVAHLLLRVVAAVTFEPFAVDGLHGRIAAAESADLGQFGVGTDLDAPSFVVREMKMQFVDIVV